MRNQITLTSLSRNVLIMGIVSFLTDFSSEMVFPLLPIFIISQLGASRAILGVIEGVAESGSSFFKFFSGVLSDKLNKRKPLIVFGYSLSSLTKPLFALINFWQLALLLRFLERTGKGIRTSPRDALIAFSSDLRTRGRAFGFHRAMDNAGELIGPVLATLLLLLGFSFRQVFLVSAIPAAAAVILLVSGVAEKKAPGRDAAEERAGKVELKGKLEWNKNFIFFILYVATVSIAVFSKALLFPVAQDKGMAVEILPILYLASPLVSTLIAYPAGVLSDKLGRNIILALGSFVYFLMSIVWIFANSMFLIIIAFGLLGLFMGLTEGQQRAFTVDIVHADTRGTALGVYHAVVGFMVLPANIIAGFLYNYLGSSYMFGFAAVASLLSLIFLLMMKEPKIKNLLDKGRSDK